MAQQRPARSWFRLASIARLEAAEAAAAAAAARATSTPSAQLLPRIPIPRPQQQPTSPPPPLQQQLPPPPPPPPTMPQPEPQPDLPFTQTPQEENHTETPNTPSFTEPQPPPTPPRSATPPESPKVIRPSNSSPPPSPMAEQTKATLIQPPPIPEPEPETKPPLLPLPHEEKTVTNSSGSRANHDSYKNPHGTPTNEDKKPRVITMAGDNTGAVMDIGSAAPPRQHADGNGDRRKMEQEHANGKKGGKMAQKTKHMGAVVNSNVQGINNSIVLNSSTTQHSPGVHITLARNRKPKGNAISSSSNQEHH